MCGNQKIAGETPAPRKAACCLQKACLLFTD